jgi:hypothetical protein
VKLVPLALVATWLAAAAPAAAKPSVTPPASAGPGASAGCVAHNLGTKPRSVTVVLRGSNGTALGSSTVDVAPGNVIALVSVSGSAFGVTCAFEGLSRSLRGYIQVLVDGTTQAVAPAAK